MIICAPEEHALRLVFRSGQSITQDPESQDPESDNFLRHMNNTTNKLVWDRAGPRPAPTYEQVAKFL